MLLSTFDLDAHVRSENRIVQTDTVRENLLLLLESQGTISDERRAEIEREDNLDVLNRWFKEECAATKAENARLRAALAARENENSTL